MNDKIVKFLKENNNGCIKDKKAELEKLKEKKKILEGINKDDQVMYLIQVSKFGDIFEVTPDSVKPQTKSIQVVGDEGLIYLLNYAVSYFKEVNDEKDDVKVSIQVNWLPDPEKEDDYEHISPDLWEDLEFKIKKVSFVNGL